MHLHKQAHEQAEGQPDRRERQDRKTQRKDRRERLLREIRLWVRRAMERTNRFLSRMRPPPADADSRDTPTKGAPVSVLSATLCLAVAALMVSGKIVEIADRLPLSPERDRWLAAAEGTDRVGNWLSLNRPYDIVRDLRGAGDDAGQRVDVIGDLEDLISAGVGAQRDPVAATTATDPPADAPDGAVTAAAGNAPPATEALDDDDPTLASNDVPEDPTVGAVAVSEGAEATTDEASDAVISPAAAQGTPDIADTEQPSSSGSVSQPLSIDEALSHLAEHEGALPPDAPEEPQPPRRQPPVSEQAPLRTYVAGDSQAFFLGVELRAGPLSDVLGVTLDQRHSTGLARPAYFNWPAQLHSVSTETDPELLVMTLGSNDWQDMRTQEGEIVRRGSDEWRAEWGRRLGVMFDLMAGPHRHVLWVGLPPTRGNGLREGYAVMNGVSALVVAERDFVTMIDIWEMFGGDEPYRDSVSPPQDPEGTPVDVRQRDGVHLNRRGAEWVVAVLEDEIRRLWDLAAG